MGRPRQFASELERLQFYVETMEPMIERMRDGSVSPAGRAEAAAEALIQAGLILGTWHRASRDVTGELHARLVRLSDARDEAQAFLVYHAVRSLDADQGEI